MSLADASQTVAEEDGLLAFRPDAALDMFEEMLRRALADLPSGAGSWREVWTVLCELDALGAPQPAFAGGLGPMAAGIVARQLGRSGQATPFVLSAAAIAPALAEVAARAGKGAETGAPHGTSPSELAARCAALSESLARGDQIATLARRPDGRSCGTAPPPPPEWDGATLNGDRALVPFAPDADCVLVPATAVAGTVLLALPARSLPPPQRRYATIDGSPAADYRFSALPVPAAALLAEGPAAERLLARMVELETLGMAAEMLGALQAMTDMTREHLTQRHQFGRPLSANQALRHRFADMIIALSRADSLVQAATAAPADAGRRGVALQQARGVLLSVARLVSQDALQMQGAGGMALSSPFSRLFRRVTALRLWMGEGPAAGPGT